MFGRLAAISGFVLAGFAQSSPTTTVLTQYCVACHNDRVKTAGVSVTPTSSKTPLENPELWEKIVLKLRHRHMPPIGMRRPDEHTYESVVGSLVKTLDNAAANHPNPGGPPRSGG